MDKSRQSPLHVAASEDKSSILEVLLQNNANADLVDVNLNNGTIIVFFFQFTNYFNLVYSLVCLLSKLRGLLDHINPKD